MSRLVRDERTSHLGPKQLGFGVRGGAEAAVHAHLRLEFLNAFNSIYWDSLLEATQDVTPDIFAFVHTAYCSSQGHWGNRIMFSTEPVQQVSHWGLSSELHRYCQHLSFDFCVFRLNDVAIRGPCTDLLQDMAVVKQAKDIGLSLNAVE